MQQPPTANPASGHVEISDVAVYEQFTPPWNVRLRQMDGGTFTARVEHVRTPGLMIYEEQWSRSVAVTGTPPPGMLMLGTNVAHRRKKLVWCGQTLDNGRFAVGHDRQVDFSTEAGGRHAVILVQPHLLARAVGPDLVASLATRTSLSLPPEQGDRIVDMMLTSIRRHLAEPALLHDPFGARRLESSALSVLGRCLAHLGPPVENTTVRRRSVRRAIEYLEHAVTPMTALELAEAVGVSQRTLDYGFREAMGLTSARYLRRHRLNMAHRDLVAAEPETVSITAVASKWGFHHPGRFAGRYRDLFGVTPSATLRARAPRAYPLYQVMPT